MSQEDRFLTDFGNTIELIPTRKLQMGDQLSEIANWDSLALLLVSVMLEDNYGQTVSAEVLRDCKTVQDLYDLTLKSS